MSAVRLTLQEQRTAPIPEIASMLLAILQRNWSGTWNPRRPKNYDPGHVVMIRVIEFEGDERGDPGFPARFQQAVSWLENRDLICPNPDQPGGGFYIVTEKGQTVKPEDVKQADWSGREAQP